MTRIRLLLMTALPLLLSLFGYCDGARILLFLPVAGKSMKNIFYGMGSAIAERGHEVVFFNPFPPSKPVKGIREIVPPKLAAQFTDEHFPNVFKMQEQGMHTGMKQFMIMFVGGPRIAIESEEFDQLLKEKFDMIIYGPFAYAFYSLAYVTNTPFAMLTPVSYLPPVTSALGNPTLPSVAPMALTSFTDRMSFLQRVQCSLAHVFMMIVMTTGLSWYGDRLVAEKFGAGTVPPSTEIERNMSLLFQSSNPVIDYHRPLLPNVVEVGGLHCKQKPSPLPGPLRDFLADSEFVYFSLGSVAKPEDMPAPLRAAVLETLGSLPYKVLLKWDTEERSGVPPNVLPSRWLPQQDILAHPRCRLFISHGGFASVLESICHGVPLLTIPISGDHQFNAANAVRLGVAVQLSWDQLTAPTLTRAVHEALEPRVREAARQRRQLLAEQPVSARRLAVHWVEHVVRHGGAPHLRSAAADLYWWQYYSLDVMAFLIAILLLLIKLMSLMLSCCCRRCFPGRSTKYSAAQAKSKNE